MQIKNYHSKYAQEVTQLIYHIIWTINSKDYTREQLSVWAKNFKNLEQWNQSLKDHYALIAIKNERIVGFGDIDAKGYLDKLYTHKDYQKTGIATAICNQLEQSVSPKIITTHASITAQTFFEKTGYITIKRQSILRNNIRLFNFIMQKNLCGFHAKA